MPEVALKIALLRCTENPDEIVALGGKLCYSPATLDELIRGVHGKDQAAYVEKLIEMGHLSPIEHASFTFGVEGVSRSLLAQLTRHRLASYSVQSQRYVGQAREEGTFNYIVPPSIKALGAAAEEEFRRQMAQVQKWYNGWADKLGTCAKNGEKANEDARFVLPNACETKLILTMNARELLHFFRLRCCNRAQWEIRALAWEMLRLCMGRAPKIFSLAGPGCISGTCHEGKMTCGRTGEVRQRFTELVKGAI
ncbi:MAG: FAD-dependent thymidylate synthase [Bacillota bacterium]|nr:FAD-dependent thymidylate synthase [Bacillota bacterium]